MSIESAGKSVDEAIFKGLQQLGISIDEVSIEIIQTETKGILGIGAKPAKVRLTQKPPEEYEVPDYMKKAEERRNRRNERSERPDRRNDRNAARGRPSPPRQLRKRTRSRPLPPSPQRSSTTRSRPPRATPPPCSCRG